MKKALSSIRRRLDKVPIWGVLLLNAAVLGLWMVDLESIDVLPYVDEIFIGGVLLANTVYLWRRFFAPPSALSAETRRRLAEVQTLFEESKSAAAALPAGSVQQEISRLQQLLDRVTRIEARLEQAELVLQTEQYSEEKAAAEIARLEAALASASEAAKPNLAGALAEARKHEQNIARIKGTRDELGAAFERVFQIFRRIHSQVIGFGLSEGSGADLAISVDELAKTLDEFEAEKSREAKLDAAAMTKVDEELEAARAKEAERLRKVREQTQRQ